MEYLPQSKIRLSLILKRDERTQSLPQQTLWLQDFLVEEVVQLVEGSDGWAKQRAGGPFEPKILALTRQSWPTLGYQLL